MMALLVYQCQRASGSLFLASAIGVFMFFGLWQVLIIRPQTFSLFLFVLLYIVLDRVCPIELKEWRTGTGGMNICRFEGPGSSFISSSLSSFHLAQCRPVMMALWANLHGGFPIGLRPHWLLRSGGDVGGLEAGRLEGMA